MKNWTLAFKLRDLVERECEKVPASIALKLYQLIEEHQPESLDHMMEPDLINTSDGKG